MDKQKERPKLSSKLVRIKALAEETLKGLDEMQNGKEKSKEKQEDR